MTIDGRRAPRVFISYAYDSEQHDQQVHEFARFLRTEGGIDVRFDQWDTGQRRDWSTWMIDQLRNAEFVLVVASPAYKRRAEGGAAASDGRGVQLEAALLRDLLAQDRNTWVPKVLPVVLPGRSIDEIPAFLQPYSASHYLVDSLTIDGIDELYRVITGQPRHRSPELGRLVARPPLTGSSRPAQAADQPWRHGHEIHVGSESYSVVEVESEEFSPDRSWIRRQALARQLTPSARLVVLRQVHILRPNDSAEWQRAALLTEGTLLADLADLPSLLDQVSCQDEVTLVLNRPEAPSLRDLYGPPRGSPDSALRLEPARAVGFLRTMYLLCRSLQPLHQRGLSHRALTPDAVLMVDGGRTPALQDIGRATIDPTPPEGVQPYQAPEQQHRGRHSAVPGVRTDIFQLAMIVHHTLTGEIPAGISSFADIDDPRLHPQLAQLLADALSPLPDDRPRDAAAFGIGLMKASDRL